MSARNPGTVVVVALLVLITTLAVPLVAWAHPLGNVTVNHYSRIQVAAGRVDVHYVLDMAEIPTYQEMLSIDIDGDHQVSDAEKSAYLDQKVPAILHGINLRVDETTAPLAILNRELTFPAGQGGLPTLRLALDLAFEQTDLATGDHHLDYQDTNDAQKLGWREIVAQAGPGATLYMANVPDRDQSDELRKYPEDMLSSPLHVSQASLSFQTTGSVAAGPFAGSSDKAGAAQRSDPLADLMDPQKELSAGVILVSLLIATGLGAAHALAPGHGKTVVGAYLVGSRGTMRHAIFLGLTVTITHTMGVFALGVITLFAQQYILPETVHLWLRILAPLLVVIVGLSMLQVHARAALRLWRPAPALAMAANQGAVSLLSMEQSGHLPHPTAPQADHQHPDHGSSPGAEPYVHSHGGRVHSHVPPNADGGPLTWRRLLALGVSGGLVPCESALIVLLSAVTFNRLGFGLLLIVAFSAGLAATLTGLGLLMVYAGHLFSRRNTDGMLIRALPALSALLITGVGVVLTIQALTQSGLVRF